MWEAFSIGVAATLSFLPVKPRSQSQQLLKWIVLNHERTDAAVVVWKALLFVLPCPEPAHLISSSCLLSSFSYSPCALNFLSSWVSFCYASLLWFLRCEVFEPWPHTACFKNSNSKNTKSVHYPGYFLHHWSVVTLTCPKPSVLWVISPPFRF